MIIIIHMAESKCAMRLTIARFVIFSIATALGPFAAGVLANGNVTLESLMIFRTHEWLGKPSVYFRCQGESKVHLPDVTVRNHQYNFIGEESWQPLTRLDGKRCKRCGFYEEDRFMQDDTFDEWELCPVAFSLGAGGHYTHFKEGEFNTTFLCLKCDPSASRPSDQPTNAGHDVGRNNLKNGSALLVMLIVLSCLVTIGIAFVGYNKWKQKKREEQQARFIKLFEDDDDLEAELGL